ncbi:MAG: hypothetical protein HQ557_11430 [Bacteroidetes bacterium]|nr:hypothetical protein [Bacteroidota bacterium]
MHNIAVHTVCEYYVGVISQQDLPSNGKLNVIIKTLIKRRFNHCSLLILVCLLTGLMHLSADNVSNDTSSCYQPPGEHK